MRARAMGGLPVAGHGRLSGSKTFTQQRDLNGARLHLVKDMAADLGDPIQFMPPWRVDVCCVVVCGVSNLVEPDLACDHLLGKFDCGRPLRLFLYRVSLARTGEGELAAMTVALALIDDAADGFRIEGAADAVHDDLGHSDLTLARFVARLEIDRGSQAPQLARPELVLCELAKKRLRLLGR